MAILAKCNASEVPQGSVISITAPAASTIQFASDQPVYLWKSERPREGPPGQGLAARGSLLNWQRSGRLATLLVQLNAHVSGQALGMDQLATLSLSSEPAATLYE